MTDEGRGTGRSSRTSRSDSFAADDDTALLVAARTDTEAFGEFFDRHYDTLIAYFASRVRSPEHAADLCAETLAAALAGLGRFDPVRGEPRQWLYGIARHKLYRFWRDLRVSGEALRRVGIRDIDLAAATDLEGAETAAGRQQLLDALDRLPESLADAVRLRVLDELHYDAIAARLQCRPGAARVRVHRGLQRLREDIGEDR